jgi:pyruvate kinase
VKTRGPGQKIPQRIDTEQLKQTQRSDQSAATDKAGDAAASPATDKAAAFDGTASSAVAIAQAGVTSVGALAGQLAALAATDMSKMTPEQLGAAQRELAALQQKLAANLGETQPAQQATLSPAQLDAKIDDLFEAKDFAALVPVLDQRIAGLAAQDLAKVDHSELLDTMAQLHLAQHQVLGAVNGLSRVDNAPAKDRALQLLAQVADLQTEAFDQAVERGDGRDPEGAVKAWATFKDTMKKAGHHSKDARLSYFGEKATAFIAKGGSLDQIKPVTADVLAGYPSGRALEFAVDAFDVARITDAESDPTPGHSLLAMGGDALTAGTLKLFKNEAGEIESAVIGTFSGHFRSPASTLAHMARHLVAAGVDPDKIVLQGGEAGTARAMEVLQRTMGFDGAEMQRQQTELNAKAARYNPTLRGEQAQDKGAADKAVDVVTKGARPDAAAFEVGAAVIALDQTAVEVLKDGAVLESMQEATDFASKFNDVMVKAEAAGHPRAFTKAMALLQYMIGDKGPGLDAGATKVLGELSAKWADHKFGSGAADPANVFSPAPPDGRRARIVATINPKVTPEQLRGMLRAGLNVARFNSAHAKPEKLEEVMALVRSEAEKLGKDVRIQLDISGPKIRLGKFENPDNLEFNDIWLKTGQTVELSNAPGLGTKTRLPVDLESFAADVKVGDRLFMNDGLVEIKVTKEGTDADGNALMEAEVVQGGKVWDRKGINMPDSDLSLPTITDDDKEVLKVLADDLDLLAVSFARKPEDIIEAREVLRGHGVDIPIIAKIERPEGMTNLESIAAVSDALMVARGDLGVEIGRENVPAAERAINDIGNRLGKPTMVATEVLMSMAKGDARATRGDIEAMYSAIHEQGADAVMLGKEASYPDDPSVVVREASIAIDRAEQDLAEKPFTNLATRG